MAPVLQSYARIFEDPPAVKTSGKQQSQSSGHETATCVQSSNSMSQVQGVTRNGFGSPSPLGERHINSPPQSRKIPLKNDAADRPPMHKKTGSSTSLKSLLRGRDKQEDDIDTTAERSHSSPKKIKSTTNLVALLKKKSKKDLRNENMEDSLASRSPKKAKDNQQHRHVPARQLQKQDANPHGQASKQRTLEEEISLYTPKDYSEYRPREQRNFYGYCDPVAHFDPPKPQYLEHKSSRSSIFTEELNEDHKEQQMGRTKNDEEYPSTNIPGQRTSQRDDSKENLPRQQYKPAARAKRSSKIFDTIAALNMKPRRDDCIVPTQDVATALSPKDLDSEMEKMLGRYDIPQNLRDQLRNLKPEVKAGLMKGDRVGSGSSDRSNQENERARGRQQGKDTRSNEESKDGKGSRSRSRTRSRILSLSRRNDGSPSKNDTRIRSSSKSRPKSIDLGWSASTKPSSSTNSLSALATPDSAVTPGDFIHYLREVQKPALVEVGKIHKLRILLRNESVAWTDAFVKKGGMDEIVQLLYRIMDVEWREEHEDNLLHETLLCLKGLSTTTLAMQRLEVVGVSLFPALLKMLFDPERKGPAEYSTRGVIISLIFSHLSATLHGDYQEHQRRAHDILSIMKDPQAVDDKQPLDFVSQMHVSRPYRIWCKEVTNVTKEVFWIFLHHMNVIPIGERTYQDENNFTLAHFPSLRAPHPAAPYVGGVEWEATQYLALHLDLLNGLIVSLPEAQERNSLREELRQSGWEKVMGGSLRTCKEKFYGSVHEGLKSWVAAAGHDGWFVEDVRAGPPREASSPTKSPVRKGKVDEAPKISLDVGTSAHDGNGEAWL